jgi:hypothetical protein
LCLTTSTTRTCAILHVGAALGVTATILSLTGLTKNDSTTDYRTVALCPGSAESQGKVLEVHQKISRVADQSLFLSAETPESGLDVRAGSLVSIVIHVAHLLDFGDFHIRSIGMSSHLIISCISGASV